LERAEILQKELPGCQDLVVILGAAHAPNMTHASALNGPLLEFLRGLPAS
jgi:hypothetical protein